MYVNECKCCVCAIHVPLSTVRTDISYSTRCRPAARATFTVSLRHDRDLDLEITRSGAQWFEDRLCTADNDIILRRDVYGCARVGAAGLELSLSH